MLFNQAAQVWNHNFYWTCLKPNDSPLTQPNFPDGTIAEMIELEFGSFASFKSAFTDTCLGHFGSGWVWLVCDRQGRLKIVQVIIPVPSLCSMPPLQLAPPTFTLHNLNTVEPLYVVVYGSIVASWTKMLCRVLKHLPVGPSGLQ